ncbi:MAG: hypothetical protein ACI9IJ_002419, partial [Psychromonas sp.]
PCHCILSPHSKSYFNFKLLITQIVTNYNKRHLNNAVILRLDQTAA